jgi:FlaA1/EpsC-like NDP-sugar epimerase
LISKLLNLSRFKKHLFFLIIDLITLIFVLLFSFSIRLGYWYWPEKELIWLMMLSPVISIPFFTHFGLYRLVVRYIGFDAIWTIVQAVTLYALFWGIFTFMIAIDGIPRSVILINWMIAIFAISGIRLFVRWFLNVVYSSQKINVIIYGSGAAGRQLSIALNASEDYNPVAFIDDDVKIQGSFIAGMPVIPRKEFKDIIQQKKVTEVLIAIPSISSKKRANIIKFLEFYPIHVKSLPDFSELVQGKIQLADLREVSVTDLLGRISVSPNKSLLSLNINNKVVMVTGAGGSIGSELCKQILFLNPKLLILFEQSELALYSIDKELAKINSSEIKIVPLLGSIDDKERVSYIFQFFSVETIYHAAAYKHVPMVEFNNTEGVKNNIFGTLCCAQLAIEHGVETFVFISTDKAVRPTNTMGATKRFSEMILQALTIDQSLFKSQLEIQLNNKASKFTRFSIVRFGNVLGSSGSVIPLFKEQIKSGGPITVTSPEILRYFMSTREAVELVIQAGAMSQGGEVFVLDMGEPVLIEDLAKKMVRLSGLEIRDINNPNGDIEIKYTGLRPGEKLYEELLIGENVSSTENPKIMMALEDMLSWSELKLIINDLGEAVDNFDHAKIRQLLIKTIPEFKPQSDIADKLFSANK